MHLFESLLVIFGVIVSFAGNAIGYIFSHWFEIAAILVLLFIADFLKRMYVILSSIHSKLDWLQEIWKLNLDTNKDIETILTNIRRASKANAIRKR